MFEYIRIRLQLRFKNRVCAASLLAESVRDVIKKEKATNKNNILILGIPRGGVITADVIAEKINVAAANFDIVIPRRLAAPHNEELAIGALMEDGTTYLDEHLIKVLHIQSEYLEKVKKEQIDEIRRRTALYRRPGLDYKINSETTVILADDGAATGATIIAAARWIRNTHNPKQLILALPVTPKDTVSLLKKEADHVEVITIPSTLCFRSVGQYYQDFNPISDEQVIGIMRRRDGPLT